MQDLKTLSLEDFLNSYTIIKCNFKFTEEIKIVFVYVSEF